MDIPSLFMIPSAVSSGKVHSVFPNSTDADFDFNRDSDATRVNSEGLIERVGYYGSELITNGSFNSSSYWGSTNVVVANGVATFNAVGGQESTLFQQNISISTTSGTLHAFTYTVKSNTLQGSAAFYVGFRTNNECIQKAFIPMTVGTHTVYGNSVGTANGFSLHTSVGFTSGSLVIDNVSVKQVTGDRARLNYEIEGGLVNTKPSLLLEPQSTNLITYSEDLSQWTLQNGGTGINPVVTVDNAISPDGTRNADRIVFNSGSGTTSGDSSQITNIVSISSGTDATASIYLKGENGGEEIVFRGVADGTYTKLTLTKEWQRFSTTENSGTNTDAITFGIRQNVSGLGTINSSATVYAWGGQIETLTYATSYIPTNGSTQTRSGETCNGAGTSSILPSEEGILYTEIAALSSTDPTHQNRDISISDGTINNTLILYYQSSLNRISVYINVGNVMVALGSVTSYTVTNFNKIAVRWKQNDFRMYINGTLVFSDTSGASFSSGTLNRINFDNAIGNDDFYGKIRDIRVYNTKEMTDSEVDILLTKITS